MNIEKVPLYQQAVQIVYNLLFTGTQVSRLYIDPYARIGSKMRMNSVEVGRGKFNLTRERNK